MLDGLPKAVKCHIIAWFPHKNWVKKLVLGVGAQGLVTLAKTAYTYPIMTSPTKKQNPKLSNFF